MKSQWIRVLSFVLSVLFLFAVTSCGGNTPSGDETTAVVPDDTTASEVATETARQYIANDIPDSLDYGGEQVTFLTRKHTKSKGDDGGWASGEITVQDLTNDAINDSVYNRKLAVEDQLGITIKEVEASDSQTAINDLVRKDMASQNGDYDIVCGSVFYSSTLIDEGLVYNLLDNGIETYLDTTKPWWSQKWIKEATLGDRLYCVTGSLALSLMRRMFVVYYNKDLATNNGLENMYDVVNEGRWTIDYLSATIKDLYKDLNGNSEADKEDQYGFLTNHYECADTYWSCFDLELITKDSEDWLTLSNQQEKISNGLEKVYALTYENPGTYDYIDTAGFKKAAQMFADGNAVFALLPLQYVEDPLFRNMSAEYGILPEYKYDEAQQNYYTFAHDQYTIFMVPVSVKDPERCGAVLEAMGCESYNSVEVAYLDTSLKGKYSNDPETRQMINIIIDGFKIDPAWIYGKTLGRPALEVFGGLIYEKSKNFSSTYQRITRGLNLGLREFREKIEKLDY